MTEDQARDKWCPFVRTDSIPVHRLRWAGEMRCVGSECMAWRTEWRGLGGEETEDGYCGLAHNQ